VVWTELYLGIVSTSIAFMLFYRLIRAWGSVRAATVTYVIPVAALALDFGLNGNVPQVNEVLGVVFVTAGVVILNLPARI
jgi:drug/metabolite transporter (DMT)-like permease